MPALTARPATDRHADGLRHFTALVSYWVTRVGLSLEQLSCIAAWGLGERGLLDKGSLSRLRHGLKRNGPSMRELDALAAANQAIWFWQQQGRDRAIKRYGPHSGWGVEPAWLDATLWLPHPEHEDEPLHFADLCEVVGGYLELPYVGAVVASPERLREASRRLADLLGDVCLERGWGPRQGVEGLLAAYPATDRARQQRLRRVVVGDEQLSADELESELHALAEMVRVAREMEGEYGPRELVAELLSEALLSRG